MDFVACIIEQVDRLVHPTVLDLPIERAQHRSFFVTRLTVSLSAVALFPFYLAGGSVPGWADALVLGWLVVPLIAAAHVAHTGRLRDGEALSAAAWIGLAFTLVLGGMCGYGPTFTLLGVAVLEASFFDDLKMSRATILATLGAAAAILSASVLGITLRQAPGAGDLAIYGLAMLYAAALSFEGMRARKIRQAIQNTESQRHRVLAEATDDLVLRFDRSGNVLMVGDSAERLFGIKGQDLANRGFFDRLHVTDRPNFLKLVSDSANSGRASTATLRLRVRSMPSTDGRYVEPVFAWVEMRIGLSDAHATNLTVPAVTASLRDVTRQVEREHEDERAKAEAEQVVLGKNQFLATVTHELRTPLNAIIGFGELLASETHAPTDPAKRREYAQIIHQSGEHLLSVVNSLLDLSKIEAGKFELTFEPFDLANLAGACCDMVGLKAQTKKIDFIRDFGSDLEIVADKRACRQILINLLSNALKFTPEAGTVALSLTTKGGSVEIAVRDTGIGIRPADLARLGDPFFQAQNGYDRAYEGTGLGLSVVNGLVNLHGGVIAVESTPGEGTRMMVTLPRHGGTVVPSTAKTSVEVLDRKPAFVPASPAAFQAKVSRFA